MSTVRFTTRGNDVTITVENAGLQSVSLCIPVVCLKRFANAVIYDAQTESRRFVSTGEEGVSETIFVTRD